MRVNIFCILLTLYILVNFGYMLIGITNAGMTVEFKTFTISVDSFVIAFIVQLFCVIFLSLFYFWANAKIRNTDFIFGDFFGKTLAIWQILYMVFNIYHGINIAGSDKRFESLNIINILFIIAPPDILYLLIAPSLKKDSDFKVNSIFYIISTVARGWMGGLFLFIIVLLSRKTYIRITKRNILYGLCIILIFFISSPYLVVLKWTIRDSGDVIASLLLNFREIEYSSLLLDSIDYIFNRFQHIGHVALMYENKDLLYELYSRNSISEYWQEGIFQHIVSRLLNFDDTNTLSKTITIYIFGQGYDVSWSANTGMAGWIVILKEYLLFYFMYVITLLFIVYHYLIKNGNKQTLLIIASLSLVFLFHGWEGMFFNVCVYFFLLFIFKKIKI